MRLNGLFTFSCMVRLAYCCVGYVFHSWLPDQPPVYHIRATLRGDLHD
jgi:hypothetical protein